MKKLRFGALFQRNYKNISFLRNNCRKANGGRWLSVLDMELGNKTPAL
jgi:hypothetical protein